MAWPVAPPAALGLSSGFSVGGAEDLLA